MTAIGQTPGGVDIAGWVLKGDPKTYDIDGELEREGLIEDWSVYDTYRTKLMDEGQRCVLWRSGPDAAIVAAGYVRGPAYPGQGDPDAWVDPAKAIKAHHFVPVELYPLFQEIPRADLKAHPVLSQAEVIRVRQGSNPSILTPEELDALEELLAEAMMAPWQALFTLPEPTWFIPLAASDEDFALCCFVGPDSEEFEEIGRFDTGLAAVLAAVTLATPLIEAMPPLDPAVDSSLPPIIDLRFGDGSAVVVLKVANGYQAIQNDKDEAEVLSENPNLVELLNSLLQ